MKIEFWVDADNDIITVDDDFTEEDIEEEFCNWLDGSLHAGWIIIEED